MTEEEMTELKRLNVKFYADELEKKINHTYLSAIEDFIHHGEAYFKISMHPTKGKLFVEHIKYQDFEFKKD